MATTDAVILRSNNRMIRVSTHDCWSAQCENLCLAGCGALVPPPYQVCNADCYDRLQLEVNNFRMREPS